MDANGVVCIVVEPQFTPVLVDTLAAGAALGRAEIDPIGTDQLVAADSYFEMMHSNAENLAQCLGGR